MTRYVLRISGVIFGVTLILISAGLTLRRDHPNPAAWMVFVGGNEVHRLMVMQGDSAEPLHPDFEHAEQLTHTLMGDNDTPHPAPDGRHIVFAAYGQETGGIAQIFRVEADGRNRQQLTSDIFASYMPEWMPDGRRIVYVSEQSGSLRLMNADGSDDHVLAIPDDYTARNIDPRPSPDGGWIAFRQIKPLPIDEHYRLLPPNPIEVVAQTGIHLIRADGSDERRVSDPDLQAYNPVWSADGSHLYFPGYAVTRDSATGKIIASDGIQLYSYELESGITTPISRFSSKQCAGVPVVSGDWIACTLISDWKPVGIYVTDSSGSEALEIRVGVDYLRWSPDGKWLLGSMRLPTIGFAMYRVSRDGKRIQQVVLSDDPISSPDWDNEVNLPWHGWRVLLPGAAFAALILTGKRS